MTPEASVLPAPEMAPQRRTLRLPAAPSSPTAMNTTTAAPVGPPAAATVAGPAPAAGAAGMPAPAPGDPAEMLARRRRELEQRFEQAEAARAAELRQRVAAMEAVLGAAQRAYDARCQALESEAIALAYAAVCQLLGEDLDDEARVARQVRQAFGPRADRPPAAVRLHPQDLALLQGTSAMAVLTQRCNVNQWLADAGLPRGGCLLEFEGGTVDAGLSAQLARLLDLWLEGPAHG